MLNYVICHMCLSLIGYLVLLSGDRANSLANMESCPSNFSLVTGYIIVMNLNLEWLDSSVVRVSGIYPEGPGFKSLSGHFHF